MTSGPNSAAFLNAILPSVGLKVAAVFEEGRAPKHIFCATVNELSRTIEEWDERGVTVYHACASYKENTSRKQDNVLEVRSFWMDIDAGEGKPYANAKEAYEALKAFLETTGLPSPLIVGSGYGVHAYWPLVASLDPVEWKRYASGLKALCQKHNLQIDASRAVDTASILRPVGSHNRKRGDVREVKMGPMVGPYDISIFAALVKDERPAFIKPATSKPDWLAAATNVTLSAPSDPMVMAQSCSQIGALRDNNGVLEEPLWYAAISALAYTEGGDGLAHKWSSGYDGYTFNETQTRLERARGLNGPTTCARFAELNPDGCAGCPLFNRISSPVQAGRPSVPKPELAQPNMVMPAIDVTVDEVILPELSAPFAWGPNGELLAVSEDAKGKERSIVVSMYPIFLSAQLASEATGDNYSYVWKYKPPLEGWRDIAIPAAQLYGMQAASVLGSKGVNIHDVTLFKQFVTSQVDSIARIRGKQVRYDQFGWKGDSFLYGSRMYTGGNVSTAHLSPSPAQRAPQLVPTGDFSTWREAANMLFAKDVEAQAFAMLSSFAAPLMKFHGENEGGAVLSLVTSASGRGKSTSLYGACSVWGRYTALEVSRGDTVISRAIVLGMMANLPVIFDEIATRDPDAAREFVEMFTNGRDKNRATQEGNLKDNVSRWQTILVCASNVSLVETVTTSNVDAAGFRILELPVVNSPHIQNTVGDKLRRAFEYNYGHAGNIFMRYLTNPDVLPWAKDALHQNTEAIVKRGGFRSEHRFWTRLMGATMTAAQIVKHLKLLDFNVDRVMDFVIEKAVGYRDDSTTTTTTDNTPYALSRFLLEHVGDVLVVPNMGKIPQRQVVARYDKGLQKLWIAERELRNWLLKNEMGARETIGQLAMHGIVKKARVPFALTKGTDLPGGMTQCVEIDASHPAVSGAVEKAEYIQSNVVELKR